MPIDLLTPLDDFCHLHQPWCVSPSWQSVQLFAPTTGNPKSLEELDATPLELITLGTSRRFREAEAHCSPFRTSRLQEALLFAENDLSLEPDLDGYTPPSPTIVGVTLLRAPIPRRVPLRIQPDVSRYMPCPPLSPSSPSSPRSPTPRSPRFRDRHMTLSPITPITVS